MIKDQTYYFHQTPFALAKDLMEFICYEDGDTLYEPFKGEGAFYNCFPVTTNNIWTEITEGKCYKEFTEEVDWVITNPPFKLPNEKGERKNVIYPLLLHFTSIAKKGIAFLVSDYGLNSLTTKRLNQMKEAGFYLQKLIVCGIKKWRGRYYFMIFTKKPSDFISGLLTTY
jgi:hypothetical protein